MHIAERRPQNSRVMPVLRYNYIGKCLQSMYVAYMAWKHLQYVSSSQAELNFLCSPPWRNSWMSFVVAYSMTLFTIEEEVKRRTTPFASMNTVG